VELVSGPGCPVCVTDPGYIDAAATLSEQGVVLATFGDLMRVPGSDATLSQIRARGAEVHVCYSPADALALARKRPDREVTFLAVGFETTVAPLAALVHRAAAEQVTNFSLLTAFKRIPPALFALLDDPEIQVDAFVLPAHVSAIIGTRPYRPVVDRYGGICVVAGFEPLDILYGLAEILDQAVTGERRLTNHYSRVVKESGNRKALALMDGCLEPTDGSWRGIGVIPESALKLRPAYAQLDAAARFGVTVEPGRADPGCLCGRILKGMSRPADCPLFGRRCTPDRAVGPCMVSSEGSCAAAYRYEEDPARGVTS
jgi:hydrogenase expression/formation protein HypD